MQEQQAQAPRATYLLTRHTINPEKGFVWVDIPEAEPHCRARLRDDIANILMQLNVVVDADGRLDYDPALVEVDVYSR